MCKSSHLPVNKSIQWAEVHVSSKCSCEQEGWGSLNFVSIPQLKPLRSLSIGWEGSVRSCVSPHLYTLSYLQGQFYPPLWQPRSNFGDFRKWSLSCLEDQLTVILTWDSLTFSRRIAHYGTTGNFSLPTASATGGQWAPCHSRTRRTPVCSTKAKNSTAGLLIVKWVQLLLVFRWGFQPPKRVINRDPAF